MGSRQCRSVAPTASCGRHIILYAPVRQQPGTSNSLVLLTMESIACNAPTVRGVLGRDKVLKRGPPHQASPPFHICMISGARALRKFSIVIDVSHWFARLQLLIIDNMMIISIYQISPNVPLSAHQRKVSRMAPNRHGISDCSGKGTYCLVWWRSATGYVTLNV
jgi:hypothetical protein